MRTATRNFQGYLVSYPKADEIGDGRHVVDWIQYGWLQCCGLTDPRDWNINSHFNCSSRSSEATSQRVAAENGGANTDLVQICHLPPSCCPTGMLTF